MNQSYILCEMFIQTQKKLFYFKIVMQPVKKMYNCFKISEII